MEVVSISLTLQTEFPICLKTRRKETRRGGGGEGRSDIGGLSCRQSTKNLNHDELIRGSGVRKREKVSGYTEIFANCSQLSYRILVICALYCCSPVRYRTSRGSSVFFCWESISKNKMGYVQLHTYSFLSFIRHAGHIS
jgi:hypothetical protein